jgi:NAD(P)H-dependent FMN reductase
MNNQPVILGTPRKGRAAENVAQFVFGEVQKREGVETELIDIRDLNLPVDDAGEAIKDPKFSAAMTRADGIVIVTPEYNQGYPGMRLPIPSDKSLGYFQIVR